MDAHRAVAAAFRGGIRPHALGTATAAVLAGLVLAGCPSHAGPPEAPDARPDATDGAGAPPPVPDALELAPIPEEPEIRPGTVVHLEYTLENARGEILDTTRGRTPLVFTYGAGQVIRGLERALAGMKAGQRKRVVVAPEDGYGPVDPTAFVEVPKDRVPPQSRRVGARVTGRTQSGREVETRVHEIKDSTVVLDLNHPLAGQTLAFEVTIILVEPPP